MHAPFIIIYVVQCSMQWMQWSTQLLVFVLPLNDNTISISNSTVNQSLWCELDHFTCFCNGCFISKLHLIRHHTYDVNIAFSSASIRYKWKWIDWDYFNVIDRRIRDRMDKMSMNRALALQYWVSTNVDFCCWVPIMS